MSNSDKSVGRFYEGWQTYNERVVEVIRDLSAEELAVRPAPDRWPIWATVGHTAGVRVVLALRHFRGARSRGNAVY